MSSKHIKYLIILGFLIYPCYALANYTRIFKDDNLDLCMMLTFPLIFTFYYFYRQRFIMTFEQINKWQDSEPIDFDIKVSKDGLYVKQIFVRGCSLNSWITYEVDYPFVVEKNSQYKKVKPLLDRIKTIGDLKDLMSAKCQTEKCRYNKEESVIDFRNNYIIIILCLSICYGMFYAGKYADHRTPHERTIYYKKR